MCGFTPREFPAGFCLVVDRREQAPLRMPLGLPWKVATLPAGDYSLEGFETRVAIERKGLLDAVLTVMRDFSRFSRELDKLRGYDLAQVVIEGTREDVLERTYRVPANRAHHALLEAIDPERVLAAYDRIERKWHLPIVWAGSRHHAGECALAALTDWWKKEIDR